MPFYHPRRAPRRFLGNAPDFVLDLLADPAYPHERYQVFLGGPFIEWCWNQDVPWLHELCLNSIGYGYWHAWDAREAARYRTANIRHRIGWDDLPPLLQNIVQTAGRAEAA